MVDYAFTDTKNHVKKQVWQNNYICNGEIIIFILKCTS